MYVLDTNVVSELRKVNLRRADPNVARWVKGVDAEDLFLSAITIQELEVGTLLLERRDSAQGALFRAWLERQVIPAFDGRILAVDAAVARCAAALHVPNPRPTLDALIAATALTRQLKLVTRNLSDFTGTGVELINPWVRL